MAFFPIEPKIYFAAHDLSPLRVDDQFIAAVITYVPEQEGPVYVGTADFGLEVKLRHRTINPLVLPLSS
jgi:hypothetical protein